jgi:hypothetical protein
VRGPIVVHASSGKALQLPSAVDGYPKIISVMGQAERPKYPGCGAYLILALPPGGKGKRAFRWFECDGPDPLKTDRITGWLNSEELQPPM